MLSRLEAAFGPAQPCPQGGGFGPAQGSYVTFPGFRGRVGFISAMSHPFCSGCNRVRLTATGFLKTCLQYEYGADLRSLLRSGAGDAAIQEAIREAVHRKPVRHHFNAAGREASDERHNMNQIGG